MKTSLKFILVVILSSIFVTSCSRKKDRFISRNYHAVTAEYNALYNGYLALEEGRQSLNDAYSDNYWDILPIERMQIIDEIILPGQSKNENFNRAEEKAVKAIQRHGMNIDGIERNRQIDDAYLLLGKSRYYTQRFIPAIEAFNYVIANYPQADLIAETNAFLHNESSYLNNKNFDQLQT